MARKKKEAAPAADLTPSPEPVVVDLPQQHYERIPLNRISVSGANPRKDFNPEALAELKASIAEHGILEPLIVRPVGQTDPSSYELVAGERRYRAATELGLLEVPCTVRQLDDRQARELMIIENLQREDLQPLEVARALEDLLRDGTMTQTDVAKKLGKSQGWVSSNLRLLQAPEDMQKLLISREITPKHAQVLLPFVAYPAVYESAMKQLGREAKEGNVSVARLEQIVTATIGNDYHGDKVLNFTSPCWNHKDLLPHMDKEACKGCASRIEVQLGNKKNLVCMNPECFKEKLKAAGLAREEAKKAERKEMLADSKPINTDLLSYGEYDRLRFADFDTSSCAGCQQNKRTATGEEVCLDPKCFSKKQNEHAKTERAQQADKKSKAVEAARGYMVSRSGPLNDRELRFVLEAVADRLRPDEELFGTWIPDVANVEVDTFKELTDAIPDQDLSKALLGLIIQEVINQFDTDHEQLIKDFGELGKPSEHVVKLPPHVQEEDGEDEEESGNEQEEDGNEEVGADDPTEKTGEAPGKVVGYMCAQGTDNEVYGTLPAARDALACAECNLAEVGECLGPSKVTDAPKQPNEEAA